VSPNASLMQERDEPGRRRDGMGKWNGDLLNGKMILTGLSIVRGEKLKELDREEEDLVELC